MLDAELVVREDRGNGERDYWRKSGTHCPDCRRRRVSASAGAPEGGAAEHVTDLGVLAGDADAGPGPLLGALPPDVLNLVILELDDPSRALFARAAGACWRAVKGTHLSCRPGLAGCDLAVRDGRLRVLQYLRDEGFPWNMRTCSEAAAGGHLDFLRYARENGCWWGPETCERAAEGGHLECLKYARENGCSWGKSTCSKAAEGGHLECLRYAHENGCSWDWYTCKEAAEGGHLECLKYARENGCPQTGFDR